MVHEIKPRSWDITPIRSYKIIYKPRTSYSELYSYTVLWTLTSETARPSIHGHIQVLRIILHTPFCWGFQPWGTKVVPNKNEIILPNKESMPLPTMDFCPPLTLVLCDSGRDNQLRGKSRGDARWESAGSNAYECIRIKGGYTSAHLICVSTTDGMAYSCFSFSHWGDTNTM